MRVSSKFFVWIFLSVLLFLIHNIFANVDVVLVNKGVSFGINIPYIVFINIICVVILVVTFFKRSESVGLFIIILGGVSNLIDRLMFGHIRDYWNLFNSGVYNNINDWIIGVGALIFIVETIWKKRLA